MENTLLTITVLGNDCFEFIPVNGFVPVTINGNQLDDMLLSLDADVVVEFEDNTVVAPVIVPFAVPQYSLVG